MEARTFCIVVCFEDDTRGRFVLVRHGKRGWELPGGWVEPHEEAVEAGRREFEEETGRQLLDPSTVRVPNVPWDHVLTGFLGGASATARPEHESAEEWRVVRFLDEVRPLSFPEDPYDRLGDALARPLQRPPDAASQ